MESNKNNEIWIFPDFFVIMNVVISVHAIPKIERAFYMRTTKATEEIEKAIIHLKKAKREISNYTFEYNVQNLIQLDKTIKQLENIKTGINADSFSVEGVKSTGEIEGARLSR